MLLQELIDTFEKLKKYVFVIYRENNKPIIVKFTNDKFFHLVGLHKINMNLFFPEYIKNQASRYKAMKKDIKKYNNILENQIKEKDTLILRLNTFKNILDLLKNDNTYFYNLKRKTAGSVLDTDYGLLKHYNDDICLLALKELEENNVVISCVPQSWIASKRSIYVTEGKKRIKPKEIILIPINMFDEQSILINS